MASKVRVKTATVSVVRLAMVLSTHGSTRGQTPPGVRLSLSGLPVPKDRLTPQPNQHRLQFPPVFDRPP